MSTSERMRGGVVVPSEKERLVAALGALVATTDALLDATSGLAGDRIAALRGEARASLDRARDQTAGFHDRAMTKARAAGRATDAYVRDHRWEVLGTAALVGIVLGAWLARDAGSENS